MARVYFISTPRAKKLYDRHIQKIYETISSLGYKNTSDFIIDVDAEKFYEADNDEIAAYYKSTTSDLREADIVVLEMSMHSLAVGHLANLAHNLGKPVIGLHTKGNVPYFLQGLEDEKLQIMEYGLDNLYEILKDALKYAAEAQDTRFNFFISPKHQNYLDWIAQKKKTPRAVHLRRLLDRDMRVSNEYQQTLGRKRKAKVAKRATGKK